MHPLVCHSATSPATAQLEHTLTRSPSCLPACLLEQLTITAFGVFRGMFKLDLGVLTGWEDVVKEFYRAPGRWGAGWMLGVGE